MEKLNLIATTTFGLEASCKRELTNLGYTITSVSDGRIDFEGDILAIAICNIWLRTADRVLLKVGEFTAESFVELFDQTKNLPWHQFIPKNAKFDVTGKSIKSKLFSVPDCQAIVKKATVESLKQHYPVDWFSEDGPICKIQVALLKDIATLTIDTTGAGLHKRGYRQITGNAPIKETLAAAMIELSYWRPERILLDPLCGLGTIAIEAAMIARNMAPGARRKFVSEDWPWIDQKIWNNVRTAAGRGIKGDFVPQIYASDIDPSAIETAQYSARRAGISDCINFSVTDISNMELPGSFGVLITNPPYGERLGGTFGIDAIYSELKRLFPKSSTWSAYIITPDKKLEQYIGRKADSKRKLFNGTIKTDYYQFHGPKPNKR